MDRPLLNPVNSKTFGWLAVIALGGAMALGAGIGACKRSADRWANRDGRGARPRCFRGSEERSDYGRHDPERSDAFRNRIERLFAATGGVRLQRRYRVSARFTTTSRSEIRPKTRMRRAWTWAIKAVRTWQTTSRAKDRPGIQDRRTGRMPRRTDNRIRTRIRVTDRINRRLTARISNSRVMDRIRRPLTDKANSRVTVRIRHRDMDRTHHLRDMDRTIHRLRLSIRGAAVRPEATSSAAIRDAERTDYCASGHSNASSDERAREQQTSTRG